MNDRYPYVTTGYQDTTKGRRLAPRMCWSDYAFRAALGIDDWMRSPTLAQRAIGITGFDEMGVAIYGPRAGAED